MKRGLLAILFFSFSQMLHSQSWQWAHRGGGTLQYDDSGDKVVTAPNGKIYCLGRFAGSIILDSTYTGGSTFIAKYNADGTAEKTIILSHASGGTNNMALNLKSDQNSNIYICGNLSGSIHINDTIFICPNRGYIASFDSSLNLRWVKQVADNVTSVTFDNDNNVYAVGNVNGNGSKIDTFSLYNPDNNSNRPRMFYAKINSDGKCIWVKQGFGGVSTCFSCARNGNEIYITGRIDSCSTLDTATICTQANQGLHFFCKIDTNGKVIWLRNYEAYGLVKFGGQVNTDTEGNCYVLGLTDSLVVINNTSIYAIHLSSYNTFFAKYDTAGNFQWIKSFTSHGNVSGSISIDRVGRIFVCGDFEGFSDLICDTITSLTYYDMYFVQLDEYGNCMSLNVVYNSILRDFAIDGEGNIIATGSIYPPSTTFGNISLVSQGPYDYFIAKLGAITGIPKRIDDMPLVIYPNPATKQLNISTGGIAVTEINIYNCTGILLSQTQQPLSNVIDISALPDGMYVAVIKTKEGSAMRKWVKM